MLYIDRIVGFIITAAGGAMVAKGDLLAGTILLVCGGVIIMLGD